MKIHNQPTYTAKTPNKKTNPKALIGSVVGTVIPVAAMMKSQKTFNPIKLEYKLKDMITVSGSAIAGGTLGGMHGENSKIKKDKFREGCFQFMNATIPAIFVAGGLGFCKKYEKFNNIPTKLAIVFSGIIAGTVTAIRSVNKIFDPKDIHPDRKLKLKDCVANADDAIGALALAKFPLISKLHLDKALPIIYAYCGYRAGSASSDSADY